MSECFDMLFDPVVKLHEAGDLAQRIVSALRDERLIIGELNEHCVLNGLGYRAGPNVPNIYKLDIGEGPFWKLSNSGVEPDIGRGWNLWSLVGGMFEGLTCPECHQVTTDLTGHTGDAFGTALNEWLDESGAGGWECPLCSHCTPLRDWVCDPPLGVSNLRFLFWNWPLFARNAWKFDIPGLFREVSGHEFVWSCGRI